MNRPPSAAAEATGGSLEAREGSGGLSLVGPPAEVRMTLQITRAGTGKVDVVELVGRIEGVPDGSNTQRLG